jgi:hypothetical protein
VVSIPAAIGSNTGRSSKHIPLFRLRRLDFASFGCRSSSFGVFIGCSLSELQATAKLRDRRYSSKRNQLSCPQLLTTALRTEPGTTLVICVLKHTTGKTAYFRHHPLSLRMHKWLAQLKFLSALPRPPPGPELVRHSQRKPRDTDRPNPTKHRASPRPYNFLQLSKRAEMFLRLSRGRRQLIL